MILITFCLSLGESKKNEPLSPTELTVIIVAVVLLLVVLVYILKKLLSHVRQEQEGPADPPPVPPVGIPNVDEDMEEENPTERTKLQANSRSTDTSSVADQQLSCNAEPLGACVARENSSVRVSFDEKFFDNNLGPVSRKIQ